MCNKYKLDQPFKPMQTNRTLLPEFSLCCVEGLPLCVPATSVCFLVPNKSISLPAKNKHNHVNSLKENSLIINSEL